MITRALVFRSLFTSFTILLLGSSIAQASTRCSTLLSALKKEIRQNPGNNTRTGKEAISAMGDFKYLLSEKIENFKETDHVLELGSGGGGLAKDIDFRASVNERKMPFMTLIDVAKIRDLWTRERFEENPRIKMIHGFVENIKPADIRPVDYVVDIYGALSYSGSYREIWSFLSEVMKPKAKLFTATRLPIILDRDGTALDFIEFFNSHVSGFKIADFSPAPLGASAFLFAAISGQPIQRETELTTGAAFNLVVVRTNKAFFLPELRLVKIKKGNPPLRIYQLQ